MNVVVLVDIDGLGSRKVGGQLLCAYRDTDDADSALTKKKQKRQGENPLAAQSGNFLTHSPQTSYATAASNISIT